MRIRWRRININIGIIILGQVVRHELNVWTGGSLLPCILLGWTYIIYIPLRKLSFRIHCIYFKLHFVILRQIFITGLLFFWELGLSRYIFLVVLLLIIILFVAKCLFFWLLLNTFFWLWLNSNFLRLWLLLVVKI